jgi:outer membrane receptor protein involved in Fe transport
MRRTQILFLLTGLFVLLVCRETAAEEETKKIGEIQVVAPREDKGVVLAPEATVINVQDYETPGIAQNISDILRDRAMVDFRGESNLVPDDDTFFLKSFEATRFTTAIDSLALHQTGGRKASHVVDYALLPTFLIDKIELLPGPHSALYPGKSIGGVINLITKRPEKYPSLKPEARVSTSYASYETQHHNMTVSGGVDSVIYDVAFDKYHTDGYLRNNEADIDTWYGRLGYILPSDGFVTLSASVSDADRQIPVDNLPGTAGYDSSYPEADTALNYEIPASWDSEAYNYRINLEQLTPIGLWTAGWLDSKQNRQRNYTSGGVYTESETVYWQEGGRIQDEIRFSENHTTTVGYDMAILYDNGVTSESKAERVNRDGWYAQHEWTIIPRLDLTAGLRHEDVKIRVTNSGSSSNTFYPAIVQRNFDEFLPKSFLTYELDDLAGALRDTSVSVGVSKIWHPPDSHGTYNGQGIPSGIFLEPEHGIGYDFIFNRRLWNDVKFKVDYGLYEIEDYIVSNSEFDDYAAAGAGRLRYSDYKLNLTDKVRRHGVDVELGGHLLDGLSFYLTYSWQYAVYKGPEPAGQTDLDQRAKHRVTTGLQYNLFENTLLMADVIHKSREVADVYDPVSEDVIGSTQIDPHEVVNLGVQQTLFKEWGLLKDGRLKFYVNNVFNERYKTSDGLPATDQVYGTALSFGF